MLTIFTFYSINATMQRGIILMLNIVFIVVFLPIFRIIHTIWKMDHLQLGAVLRKLQPIIRMIQQWPPTRIQMGKSTDIFHANSSNEVA